MRKKAEGYSGLSRDEVELISRSEYSRCKVLTGSFAVSVFKDRKKASNVLSRLCTKGRLIKIQRGKYLMVPMRAPKQLWTPNEFATAAFWMGDIPYYIGYFTMYNYWEFTEQVPRTVFVLNTKRSYSAVIAGTGYKAVKIRPDKYYGFTVVDAGGEKVRVSDRERTLVDLIYNPIGSFRDVREVIRENMGKIDIKKFVDYLIRYPEAAVRKRGGYLLEEAGVDEKILGALKSSVYPIKTYIVLDPFNRERKGSLDKEWGVIVNERP